MSQEEMLQAILKKLDKLDTLESSVNELKADGKKRDEAIADLKSAGQRRDEAIVELKSAGQKRDESIAALNRFATEQLELNVSIKEYVARIEEKFEKQEEWNERIEGQLTAIYSFLEREVDSQTDSCLEESKRYTNLKVAEHEEKFVHTPVAV